MNDKRMHYKLMWAKGWISKYKSNEKYVKDDIIFDHIEIKAFTYNKIYKD